MQDREPTGFERHASAHPSRKNPEMRQHSRIFSFCLNESLLAQNCFAPQKVRLWCRTRQKAQEYRRCIPSIFNDVWRRKILFEAVVSLPCTPLWGAPIFLHFGCHAPLTSAISAAMHGSTTMTVFRIMRSRSCFHSFSVSFGQPLADDLFSILTETPPPRKNRRARCRSERLPVPRRPRAGRRFACARTVRCRFFRFLVV